MADTLHLAPVVGEMPTAVVEAASTLVMLWGEAEQSAQPQVSPAQLRALLLVDQHGSMNLNALADGLGAIPSSASRLCDRLVAAGLLTRHPGEHNRREVRLGVSRDGRRLIDDLADSRRSIFARVLNKMAPADRAALLTGLSRFNAAAAQTTSPLIPRLEGDRARSASLVQGHGLRDAD